MPFFSERDDVSTSLHTLSGPCRSVFLTTIGVAWRTLVIAIALGTMVKSGHELWAQAPDSPVKVHGGSMTFFSEGIWNRDKTSRTPSFCAVLSAEDLKHLRLENFFPVIVQDFLKARPVSIDINNLSDSWHIDIVGHLSTETDTLQPSKDGMRLQVSPKDCTGGNTSASIHLTPIGRSNFYFPDLIPAGHYQGNKRFLSRCGSKQRDRCERIAEIRIFNPDPNSPTASEKPQAFSCPNGACTLYIGVPKDTQSTSPSAQ